MTYRELMTKLIEYAGDIDDEIRVDVIKTNEHLNAISRKTVPIRRMSVRDTLCIESNTEF